jgi:hypothetical protein
VSGDTVRRRATGWVVDRSVDTAGEPAETYVEIVDSVTQVVRRQHMMSQHEVLGGPQRSGHRYPIRCLPWRRLGSRGRGGLRDDRERQVDERAYEQPEAAASTH